MLCADTGRWVLRVRSMAETLGRHADGLGLYLAGQLRQQAFDAAGQTGRHRNDRLHGRTRAAQVVVVIAVDQRLVVHHRVQRGEQGLLDADFAIEQIQQRHDGIGRAGGGGDQLLVAGQAVLVDAGDDGRIDISPLAPGCESSRRGQPASRKRASSPRLP
jgi:hypothetical protein